MTSFCTTFDEEEYQKFASYMSDLNYEEPANIVYWQYQGNWVPNGTTIEEEARRIKAHYYALMVQSNPIKFFAACKASHGLWLGLPQVILLIGTIGNVLSFLVLCHPSMNQISSYIYLATLAIADELVLVCSLLRAWLKKFGVTVASTMSCKLVPVISTASSWLSVWLIIALTVERVIVITFPLHANRLASPTRAKVIILSLAVAFLLVNLHFFETGDLVLETKHGTNTTVGRCDFKEKYHAFRRVWSFIDAAMYCYVPELLISIMNSIILIQVHKARKSRRRLFHGQDSSNPCVKVVSSPISSCSVSSNPHSTQNSATVRSRPAADRQLTVMLVVISVCFLITTAPIVIVKVLIHFLDHYSYQRRANFELADTVATLLMYMNHAMNFYLYCATGNKFRQQLQRLLCRNRRMHETVVNHSGQSNSNFQARLQVRRSTRSSALNSCDEAVEMRTLLPANLAPARQHN